MDYEGHVIIEEKCDNLQLILSPLGGHLPFQYLTEKFVKVAPLLYTIGEFPLIYVNVRVQRTRF